MNLRASRTGLRASRTGQVLLFFAVVFIGTFGLVGLLVLAPSVFGEASFSNPLVILGVYFPSLSSIGLTAWLEGREGLRRLARRLNPLGFHPSWYLAVLLGIPALMAVGMLVTGGRPSFVGATAALTAFGAGLVFDPGPIGEELGWRGYALPRLLDRFSPFVGTLILGIVWACWHLPAFFLPGMPQSELNLGMFFVGAVSVSMVMTWTHLNTGGSILLAMLIHMTANHGGEQIGSTFNQSSVGFLIGTLLIFAFARSRFFRRGGGVAARGEPPAT